MPEYTVLIPFKDVHGLERPFTKDGKPNLCKRELQVGLKLVEGGFLAPVAKTAKVDDAEASAAKEAKAKADEEEAAENADTIAGATGEDTITDDDFVVSENAPVSTEILEGYTPKQLETYAQDRFDFDLDLRWKPKKLLAKIADLETEKTVETV